MKTKKPRFEPGYASQVKELYAIGKKTPPAADFEEKKLFTTQTQKDFAENKQTCRLCGHFTADKIGDGTGIGACALNIKPAEIKWPGTPACEKFV